MPKNNSKPRQQERRVDALTRTRLRRLMWTERSDSRNYTIYPGESREDKVAQCDREIDILEGKLARR